VVGGWRKLHNEELYKFYFSLSRIKMIKSMRINLAGHVARIRQKIILVEMPEGKTPPARPSRRWEDNIKMDLGEIRWGDMDWIDLAEDRDQWRAVVNTVMTLLVT
jgi:hypothetical protein